MLFAASVQQILKTSAFINTILIMVTYTLTSNISMAAAHPQDPFTSCGGQYTQDLCNKNSDKCAWMDTWCADKTNCGAFWYESACNRNSDTCTWMGTWCTVKGGIFGRDSMRKSNSSSPKSRTNRHTNKGTLKQRDFGSCGGYYTRSMCLQHTNECFWMDGTWCADKSNCGAFWQQNACRQNSNTCTWMGTWCANK